MWAFQKERQYPEVLMTLKEGMKRKTFESMTSFPHERGFNYLVHYEGDKKRVMKILKTIDSDLGNFPPEDGMLRKLGFFLEAGILLGEYDRLVDSLSVESFSTLVTSAILPSESEQLEKILFFFCDNDLLLFLRNHYSECEQDHIFWAMLQHYEESEIPKELDHLEEIGEFRNREIEALKNDQDRFLNGVKDEENYFKSDENELGGKIK